MTQDKAHPTPPAVPSEPMAWAVYWGLGAVRKNSVHFEKATADEVAASIKSCYTEVRPLYAAPLASEPEPAVAEQARNAEDFLDLGLADVQDESGLLRYYSRDAVLECIAAVTSQSTPPPESAGPQKESCDHPPLGYRCTRTKGHHGPCACIRIDSEADALQTQYDEGYQAGYNAALAANPTAQPDGGSKA